MDMLRGLGQEDTETDTETDEYDMLRGLGQEDTETDTETDEYVKYHLLVLVLCSLVKNR